MKINLHIIIAIIYFFFNSVFLPFGLTYTALLSPFLYIWICKKTSKEILLPFISILAIFSVAHLGQGVDIKAYLVSVLNYAAVYISCFAVYVFLKHSHSIPQIFKITLLINFIFCLLSIAIYPTWLSSVAWMNQDLSRGIEDVSRLKLFTYEASYYALILVPVFLYYLLKTWLGQQKMNPWFVLLAISLPLVLSFSLGVIASLLVSCFVLCCFYFRRLLIIRNFRTLFLIISILILIASVLVIFIFPENELFARITNIIEGEDTSGKGRTSDAFLLANEIVNERSALWGVGPGQVKILGADIIRSYYLYDLDYETIAIPNAVAETYAIFGWMGILLRFFLIGSLFFITRVWTNYYRFALFVFIFVYQFTGSFITNIAEYVLWIISFSSAFVCFNVKQPTGRRFTYSLQKI